jgi:NADH-quinone oxidoreductase subunit L
MNLSEMLSTGLFFDLVPWVVLIPLIGLLLNMIIGGKISEKLVGVIASLAVGLAFVVSLLLA